MNPVNFPGSNTVFNPPASMPECAPLHAFVDGEKVIHSVWELSGAELKELIVSRRICLQVWGGGQPPVALSVVGMNCLGNNHNAKPGGR